MVDGPTVVPQAGRIPMLTRTAKPTQDIITDQCR
jgi:hypothetical protein